MPTFAEGTLQRWRVAVSIVISNGISDCVGFALTPNAACTSPGAAYPENVHPRGPIRLPFLLAAADSAGQWPPAIPETGHCSDLKDMGN